MGVASLERYLRGCKTRENERGNTIHETWVGSCDRYRVDCAPDFTSEGWEQFDTDQDAHYFGVWLNRSKLLTLTYAEGDWTLVVCSDAAHYNAEVADAIRFYGEGFVAKAIDAEGVVTVYRQERSEFLIGGAS